MGQWFREFLTEARYNVLISGRRTPLTYQQCIEQSDVVIINVPIRNTVDVIHDVGQPFSTRPTHCRQYLHQDATR